METIEIVEKLLPMLQEAGEGAFWLILLLIVRPLVQAVLVVFAIAWTVNTIARWVAMNMTCAKVANHVAVLHDNEGDGHRVGNVETDWDVNRLNSWLNSKLLGNAE